MNNTVFIVPVAMIIFLIVMTLSLFGGNIVKLFHLTDRRGYIKSEETFEKLNAMMAAGDVSLYTSEWSDRKYIRISLTYKVAKEETVSNAITGADINKIIDEAYAWSVDKGFVKPEIVSPVPESAPVPSAK